MENAKAVIGLLDAANKVLQDMKQRTDKGHGFNVFHLCGVDHYETMHSKIIAEFLDPHGCHAQGECFLKSFSKMLWEKFGFNGSFTKSATVSTEISGCIKDGSIGRFDIIIEDIGKKSVCIIENKIFAGEQPEQLERYSKWLKRERKGWNVILVFLTLGGREAWSIKDNSQYKRLAYFSQNHDVPCLTGWIDDLCKIIGKQNTPIRYALEQYKDHVINLAKGELAMEEALYEMIKKSSKRIKKGSKSGMMAAAEMVAKYYEGIKWKLVEELMEEVSGRLGDWFARGEMYNKTNEPGYAFFFKEGEKEKGSPKFWCAWENRERLFIGVGSGDGFLKKFGANKFKKWRDQYWDDQEKKDWEKDDYCPWPLRKWINSEGETWDGQLLDRIISQRSDDRENVISEIVRALNDLHEIMSKFWEYERVKK